MEKNKMLVKQVMQDNRFKVLLGIFVISTLTSLISVVINKFDLLVFGIVITTIMSFYYLVNIQDYVLNVQNGKEMSTQDLLKPGKIHLKAIKLFAVYILIALATFFAIQQLSGIPQLGVMLIVIMLLVFALANIGVSLSWFSKKSLKNTVSNIPHKSKLVGAIVLKYLTTIVQGIMLIILVNIFVYAPQIAEALKQSQSQSTEIMRTLFSSDFSNFIQMCGVQMIVYYLLFIGSVYVSSSLKVSKQLIKEV